MVATFESVTSDFGGVVRAVNERFGTEFAVFEHTDENVARCFARIDEDHVRHFGRTIEQKIARPSVQRVLAIASLRPDYRSEPQVLRERAAELHARLSSVAASVAVAA